MTKHSTRFTLALTPQPSLQQQQQRPSHEATLTSVSTTSITFSWSRKTCKCLCKQSSNYHLGTLSESLLHFRPNLSNLTSRHVTPNFCACDGLDRRDLSPTHDYIFLHNELVFLLTSVIFSLALRLTVHKVVTACLFVSTSDRSVALHFRHHNRTSFDTVQGSSSRHSLSVHPYRGLASFVMTHQTT